MTNVLRILVVMLCLVSSARASFAVRFEMADERSLRELGMTVTAEDLKDIPKMQELLLDGFASFGLDYAIEGALMLYDPRTGRVFFMHPSLGVAKRTSKLLRSAMVLANTA